MDPKRPLSEISHLFLSEIRARQPGGPRTSRIAPPKPVDVSVDMTPEEFAASLGDTPGEPTPLIANGQKSACVSVVIAAHLMEQSGPGIRQYARQLAEEIGKVGVMEIGSDDFAVTCFEKDGGAPSSPMTLELNNTRKISEFLSELSFDVQRWLICLPHGRTPESRELLQAAPHWVLLTTADHEGVVATYRALKGLSELGRRRVSLVVLDAADERHADAVFRKLDTVSRQFLHCGLEAGPTLRPARNVTEHPLLNCHRTDGQPATSAASHWRIIQEMISTAVGPTLQPKTEQTQTMKLNLPENPKMPAPENHLQKPLQNSLPEVIDLPGDATERSILDAVVRQGGAEGRWVMCPIHPPMCPEALLAVGRDQRLILLAVAARGLGQLFTIGQALRWISENGELIRMALPQLAIDSTALPAVTLLVDHSDLSAEVIQPLLQSGTVTVQAYRRIKWGTKTGLLLEAA